MSKKALKMGMYLNIIIMNTSLIILTVTQIFKYCWLSFEYYDPPTTLVVNIEDALYQGNVDATFKQNQLTGSSQ